MSDADTLSKLSKLNEKYQMFNDFCRDGELGDAKFLFSAKDASSAAIAPSSMPHPSPS